MVHCLPVYSTATNRQHPPKRSTQVTGGIGDGDSTSRSKYTQKEHHSCSDIVGADCEDKTVQQLILERKRSPSLSEIPPRPQPPQQQQQQSVAKTLFAKMSKSMSALSYNEDEEEDDENHTISDKHEATNMYMFSPVQPKLRTISSSKIIKKQYHEKDDVTAMYAFSPSMTKKKNVQL